MNIKLIILSVALIAITLIACDFGSRSPTDNESPESKASEPETSESKQRWFSDTRPTQFDIDAIVDAPGVAVKAEDGDAFLFADCDLLFVAIDWPAAILLGSGETMNTIEQFLRENEFSIYSYEWYGSSFSRKRVVRAELFFGMTSSSDRLNTQDFIREFTNYERLEISQVDNLATFNLVGFESAFGKHCS